MNTSIFTADRTTHIKIVVMALVTAIAVTMLSIAAYKANIEFAVVDDTIHASALVGLLGCWRVGREFA
jgi:hypothetical protein